MVTEEVIHSLGEYKLLDVAKLLVLVEVMPELNDITRMILQKHGNSSYWHRNTFFEKFKID